MFHEATTMNDSTRAYRATPPLPGEALADLESIRQFLTNAALGRPLSNQYSVTVSARRVLSAVESLAKGA
jgi:hypothetical protein